jgi:uncharacterized protein (TIGR04255 family)
MDAVYENASEIVHLKNPPIVEATIGINVALLPESALDQFDALSSEMGNMGYGASKPVTAHKFQVNFNVDAPSVETQGSKLGLRFDGNSYTAQFKRDGFLFSRLGAYENWETFTGEAKRVWEPYSQAIGPAEFTEFGVRYINKIYVPDGHALDRYLRVYPLLSETFPQQISESFMRLGFSMKDPEGRFVHQHILIPPERDGHSTVLLDNDFRFSAIGLTPSAIWERLEKVRKIKDQYFFALITNELRDSFNA